MKALESQKELTKKAEEESRKLRIAATENTKLIEELRKEVFILKGAKAILKPKPTKEAHHHHETNHTHDFRHIVDTNHSHVEVYKKLLRDKETELEQVNARLRRMLFVWNRGQLQKKSAWVERHNMLEEMESLRAQISASRKSYVFSSMDSSLESGRNEFGSAPDSVRSWVGTSEDYREIQNGLENNSEYIENQTIAIGIRRQSDDENVQSLSTTTKLKLRYALEKIVFDNPLEMHIMEHCQVLILH